MIKVNGLSKHYGSVRAVDDLTFSVSPGVVTGFLGPNGAGKSTTMRMIVGLDRPTAGTALIDGKRYSELKHPIREVGALLDAKAVHPNRSAANHLKWVAQSNGGWMKCWTLWDSRKWRVKKPGDSRWAWGSAWVLLPHCWVTQKP